MRSTLHVLHSWILSHKTRENYVIPCQRSSQWNCWLGFTPHQILTTFTTSAWYWNDHEMPMHLFQSESTQNFPSSKMTNIWTNLWYGLGFPCAKLPSPSWFFDLAVGDISTALQLLGNTHVLSLQKCHADLHKLALSAHPMCNRSNPFTNFLFGDDIVEKHATACHAYAINQKLMNCHCPPACHSKSFWGSMSLEDHSSRGYHSTAMVTLPEGTHTHTM